MTRLAMYVAMGLLLAAAAPRARAADERASVIVVVGAEGAEEFTASFHQWAERWAKAAAQGKAQCLTIGLDPAADKTDRELLAAALAQRAVETTEPLWLVLIGHGTFDGKTARFNLRGPDISPAELKEWLKPIQRPLAIINCASSSGPFVAELSAPGRVVVASTRSGHEYNFSRFGDYLSAAIANPAADLDKDQQTSLLEAFLMAASNTREFYSTEVRLATEHAILDDNGDRLGTPADWFQGLRPVKEAKDNTELDGTLAGQFILVRGQAEEQLSAAARAERDALELELAQLRRRKAQLAEDEYFSLLEPLLVKIARVYNQPAATNP